MRPVMFSGVMVTRYPRNFETNQPERYDITLYGSGDGPGEGTTEDRLPEALDKDGIYFYIPDPDNAGRLKPVDVQHHDSFSELTSMVDQLHNSNC